MARIAVAMSGGVDSSVAAALLVGAGHEVVGFTLNLWPTWAAPSGEGRGCCGLGAVEDARSVARTLGIRHYVLNLREEFEREVIRDFAREYARGRTPNPCVACNRSIKFSLLLQRVRGLGMDLLATGHYARVARHPSGRVRLLRGADRHKDQSYVLACLTQEQLASVCFPVGSYTKATVRELARRWGLPVAGKPDSQEICFVPAGGYADVVARYAVLVGDERAVHCTELVASELNWIAVPELRGPRQVTARIRHAAPDVPAVITPAGEGRLLVRFPQPPRAPAPGQAVAFYDGDVVLGGGVVAEVRCGKEDARCRS